MSQAIDQSSAGAAEWQWSVEVPGVASHETDGAPRAFLWIPPSCDFVRGLVVGQHTIEEEPILEHATFRAELGSLGFGAIWITPPLNLMFEPADDAGPAFDAMLRALARVSGYTELVHAPIVPIGHSAAAFYPWNFARWAPHRTLAVISISGQWPTPMNDPRDPLIPEPLPAGIPGLVTIGEYEWADERAAIGLRQRGAYPDLPLTMLAEGGGGHFDVSDEKVAYLALYLRKAAAYRLPPGGSSARGGGPPELQAIDPITTGWLVDRWRANEPPRVPAAPVAEYAEPEEAFWCFDEEHAVATEKFRLNQRGKRAALLGFVQAGALLPQVPTTHQQVTIPFLPTGDGLTFQLSTRFLDTVPEGRPERWTGLKAGTTLSSPTSNIPSVIERICGPVAKLSDDTFAVRFYRMGMNNAKRSSEIWLVATHPGDARFKRSVQQAVLRFPLRNSEGADQSITFDAITDQRVGTASLPLKATSSAGANVSFYVREGPARIASDGRTLVFTTIPPRAKFPVSVTVVAWQWGRSIEPLLKTAAPLERTFALIR